VTTPERKHLRRSVLRQTGRDPAHLGYWLRRHRRAERLRPSRLARKLGLTMEGLVLLSLCRTPREDCFRDDLEAVCRCTGADAAALAQVLRQEQALAGWAEERPPQGQGSPQGWLIAASDAPPPEGESPEEPPVEGDDEP
jgi:hypothetical protein